MFAKRLVIGVQVLVALLSLAVTAFAGDQNFPVGFWIVDAFGADWRNSGLPPSDIAQFRWHGIDIGGAGGVTDTLTDWSPTPGYLISRNIQRKLARYDSLGMRILLCPTRFHWSYPLNAGDYGTPRNFGMDVRGHDPFGGIGQEYFVSQGKSGYAGGGGDTLLQTPSAYWTPQGFEVPLDSVMSLVVDSVKNAHALWRYLYWDEFNGHHVWKMQKCSYCTADTFYYNRERYMRYWENVWMDAMDNQLRLPDSMGVGSRLKWKIEHRDLVHSVCQNLGASPDWNNCVRTYTTLKYRGPTGDTASNKPKSFCFDVWPYYYGQTNIGDTLALKNMWTSWQDTAVAYSKAANPSEPARVYMTQLQHVGTDKATVGDYRIPTPEEVRELANLAVLHEIKGFFHFILPSSPWGWANAVDENNVPFDAPYENYVYARDNTGGYYEPNNLSPFNPSDPIHDPFRSIGQRPNPDSSQRGKEIFNLWKYAPYARNWNFMRTINDPVKIIAPHLPDLWKVGQRITSVVPDAGVSASPEYVTFADSVLNHPPTAFYAFIVSKDFNSTQQRYTVTVNGNGLPHPPTGQRYYVLDLNSRHLIPSTGNIVFHTVLKPGEGRLFRFIIGPQPSGGGSMGAPLALPVPNPYNGSIWSTLLVTDPDISFYKSGQGSSVQFTEGDTVVLSAKVYNLGFSAKSDTVKFYIGDPLAGGTFLGKSYVTVPALSPDDTLPKFVTVTYNWVANSSSPLGPYDINVFLKGASSSAHSLLWLNAEDYATKVNNNPWDMTEEFMWQDIVSSPRFNYLTDSISGAWEGTTIMDTLNPELHFKITNPIDASKYKLMKFRIYSHQEDSCTVRWYPQQPGVAPGMTVLPANTWQEVTVNLGALLSWGGSVTDFYLQFPKVANKKIRLSWAKLTTR